MTALKIPTGLLKDLLLCELVRDDLAKGLDQKICVFVSQDGQMQELRMLHMPMSLLVY
jgi:hypothetical protein